jgi:ribose transport system ATP-binding protein
VTSASSSRLQVRRLSKSYGGIQALREADLDLRRGEVLALVGENGAGKSTLLKAISGTVSPDEGQIVVNDEEFEQLTPKQALGLGIAIVPQELAFVERMRVGEALALRTQRFHTRGGLIRWRSLNNWAQRLLDDWELGISARDVMGDLAPAQHVAVSIVGALQFDAQVIILDEPTASFSPPETEHLFGIVRKLRSEGRSIVYVSHRLEEVLTLSDRITVMREGRTVGTRETSECTRHDLVEMIVGREVAEHSPVQPPRAEGPIALDVAGLRSAKVGPVSFAVRRGEILGFAGLVGAGRTEMFRLLYGLDRPESGTVALGGSPVVLRTAAQAVKHGIALVPEERRAAGLVLKMSTRENATLSTLTRYARPVVRTLRRRQQRDEVFRLAERVRLRTSSMESPVGTLSGGNQQKVVIARCLNAGSDVLIFDEPTRGVDVGAKAEIFELIREAAASGATVLVASSETDDLVGLCHRVIVMKEGSVVRELEGNAINASIIARLCFGDI